MTRKDARLDLRRSVQDWIDTSALATDPPSHLSRLERATPLTGVISTTKVYVVRHHPILSLVTGGVEQLAQAIDQAGTVFVVDPTTTDYLRGFVHLTTQPTSSSTRIHITYFSQWFSDGELNQFLQDAMDFISTGGVEITDDVTALPFDLSLKPAFMAYARFLVYDALSAKTGDFFDYSAGGKDAKASDVPKHYAKKAETAEKSAHALQLQATTRQGRREIPSFGWVTPSQRGQPLTPTR